MAIPERHSAHDARRFREPLDVAVIGGGAAGLSIAKLLDEAGAGKVAVFETSDRVGGKSLSVGGHGDIVEMGTCYTTLSHGLVKKWMRKKGVRLKRNGLARYDGRPFRDYVEEGGGAGLMSQMRSYLKGAGELRRRLEADPTAPETCAEAAQTIEDWLQARDLPKMERFLQRIQTVMGYGFLDETTAVQAQTWCTLGLVASGVFNQMHMPVEGWSEVWRRIAEDLDVRLGARVEGVERGAAYAVLHTAQGEVSARQVVNAIPLDEFAGICALTQTEARIRDAVAWGGYATTLVSVKDWFTDYQVDGYSETVKPGAPLGQMVGARLEARDAELGTLYVTGQLPGDYTGPELAEILRADVVERGGRDPHVIQQRVWKYFPRWRAEAVADGLLRDLRAAQGEARTWHTGATFAFEAVSHIVNHNARLAPRVRAAVRDEAGALA